MAVLYLVRASLHLVVHGQESDARVGRDGGVPPPEVRGGIEIVTEPRHGSSDAVFRPGDKQETVEARTDTNRY